MKFLSKYIFFHESHEKVCKSSAILFSPDVFYALSQDNHRYGWGY